MKLGQRGTKILSVQYPSSSPDISTSCLIRLQKHTFDLQSAWDKISHFEDGLKAKRSSVIYPNIFAAKFREEFEKERRRKERERVNEGGSGIPA